MNTVSLDNHGAMEKWDAFVESHPSATPNHMSGWLRTIRDTYNFLPELYCVKDANGEFAAVMPIFKIKKFFRGTRINSLPFSDYGGLLPGPHGEGWNIIETVLTREAVKADGIEIRGPVPEAHGFVRHNYYKRHLLDLRQDTSEIKKLIRKRTIQYSIRKAERAGIVVREARDESGMREFIRLNALTRKKHGIPSQPKKWFEALQKNVIATGNGFILLAEKNLRVIGATLFLTCGRTLYYKYNASDPAILRSFSPNHLMTWAGIQWGIENKYTTLDFGRDSPENEGLMRYKAMWATTIADLPYYYYPRKKGAVSKKETSMAFRLFTWLWKRIPIKLGERISTKFFKHLA